MTINVFSLRTRVIALIALILFIYCLLPVRSLAASPKHWISLAENSLIYEGSYTVDRTTEVYQRQRGKSAPAISKKLIQTNSGRLKYTKDKGLKPFPPQKKEGKTSLSHIPNKPSVFTLDVSHMLKKMKGKAQWVIEDETALFNDEDCVITSSSGNKWLVRLWIRKTDGVVLRYDQYLNEQLTASSTINYDIPRRGKYFPQKSSTEFKSGYKFIQYYENYTFIEN